MAASVSSLVLSCRQIRHLGSGLPPEHPATPGGVRGVQLATIQELPRWRSAHPADPGNRLASVPRCLSLASATRAMHYSALMSAKLIAEADEPGKKLDFLLQEMQREANTLLSKTPGLGEEGLAITDRGLHLKAEIEKLREQVQNVE